MTLRDCISRAAVAASFCVAVTACGGGGGSAAGEGAQAGFSEPVPAVNSAPVITGAPRSTALESEFYEFAPTASDPDGDPIVFGIAGQPAWAEFDAGSGRLFGTPGALDVGWHRGIVISASDGKDESPLPAMDIEVMPQPVANNTAPAISGTPAGTITVGASYDFLPAGSDADGDQLDFTIENQPAWAKFDRGTGWLSGTPDATDIGEYAAIVISVSDGAATTSLGPFLIVVNPPPIINSAPSISGQPPTGVIAGEAFWFTPATFDPENDFLSFSVLNPPSWSAFDTGSGTLSGTPASENVGVHSGISISVSDGEFEVWLGPFSIEVIAPNTPPQISGLPTPNVVKNETYIFVPEASDADGDVLAFSIFGQPSWASFSEVTGALTGLPAASDAGLYENISITVTDGQDAATLGPFSVHVLTVGPRAAELSWTPPTENSDGSALTDLSGYVVYWGMTTGNYANSVTLENPGLTSYVVENLAPGRTYYFAVSAYNEAGLESGHSNEASKGIADDP